MSADKKVVMAIGGHIGDAELTSGGVLATMALKGYQIITVALTGEAIVFPYADGELPDTDKVRYELCDIIRKYKPCVILSHWKNSMHKDHETTFRIVKDAHFLAGLASLERKDKAHFAKGPYYAENWEDSVGFQKYLYMEVSKEGFELWKKAIETHWFTVNSTSFHYKEYYEHLMKCNGCLARKEYAEAFNIEEDQKRLVLSEL